MASVVELIYSTYCLEFIIHEVMAIYVLWIVMFDWRKWSVDADCGKTCSMEATWCWMVAIRSVDVLFALAYNVIAIMDDYGNEILHLL